MNDAWLAGLIEGEGSFGKHYRKDGTPYSANISITSTDEDVIKTAHSVAGEGSVAGPYKHKERQHKPVWVLRIYGRDAVVSVINRIYPYMHERRRIKMDEIISLVHLMKQRTDRELPIGVYKTSKGKRFRAQYKNKHIGNFATAEEAEQAYKEAKDIEYKPR